MEQFTDVAPYIRLLGIDVEATANQATLQMRYSPNLIGLEALHAGPVGTLLECAAFHQLFLHRTNNDKPRLVSLTLQFIRAGRKADTYAQAVIVKQGRNLATVRMDAWQDDRSRPIATGQASFLLRDDEATAATDT